MLDTLDIPILQAPMLGASSPALAAAVSNAGGLGSVALGALAPEKVAGLAAEIRALTTRPFGINLFVQRPAPVDKAAIAVAVAKLRPWRDRFGLSDAVFPRKWFADFEAQLQAVIACRPAVASFTFGCLTAEEISRLHAVDIFVIGTATTTAEARMWEAAGADAICLQGLEAGGHRGSFTPNDQTRAVPLRQLLQATSAVTRLPLIAAGGIMTGRDIAEVLKTGGVAAQLGTAFLLCPEATTNAPWRAALKNAGGDTRLTRAFSGRYARGIVNAFMDDMAEIESALPDYPVQNILTGDLRTACAKAGSSDCLSLWAGTNYANAREMPAAELVRTLWAEAA